MTIRILAGAAAALLVAAPSSAAAPTPARAADSADGSQKVCKMIVPTGSILGKRFCLTKAEWNEFGRLNQESADRMLEKRSAGMCSDGSGGATC